MSEEKGVEKMNLGFLMKGDSDPNSILGKAQSGIGMEFLQGIIKQLDPFIEPMIQGITESLGNDETMILLRRNKKDGKAYVYVIDTSKVDSFKLKEDAVKEVVEGEDFVKSMLSGDLSKYFKPEEGK